MLITDKLQPHNNIQKSRKITNLNIFGFESKILKTITNNNIITVQRCFAQR